MKRILSLLLVLVLVSSAVFAFDFKLSDFSFAIGEDIQIPTLLSAGVTYKGLTLSEGNSTAVTAVVGGGKGSRTFYDENFTSNTSAFSTVLCDVKLSQGFENDLYKVTVGMKNVYEKDVFASQLYAGVKYSTVEDKMVSKDGFEVSAEVRVAPELASANNGFAFYGVKADASYFKTIYEKQRSNGLNLFSVVLADRVFVSNVSPIGDSYVHPMAVSRYSAGAKVRGYSAYYNPSTFNAVNNFEIRLSSPEPIWDGVFARLNLFADAGFKAGDSLKDNSSIEGCTFYSVGAELALSILDYVNVGVRVSCPSEKGWTPKMGLMFGLQF